MPAGWLPVLQSPQKSRKIRGAVWTKPPLYVSWPLPFVSAVGAFPAAGDAAREGAPAPLNPAGRSGCAVDLPDGLTNTWAAPGLAAGAAAWAGTAVTPAARTATPATSSRRRDTTNIAFSFPSAFSADPAGGPGPAMLEE